MREGLEYDLEDPVAWVCLSVIIIVAHLTSGLNAYQHPPESSLRSKTRIVSNAFSCARASIAVAPAGPKPITATLLIVDIAAGRWHKNILENPQRRRIQRKRKK